MKQYIIYYQHKKRIPIIRGMLHIKSKSIKASKQAFKTQNPDKKILSAFADKHPGTASLCNHPQTITTMPPAAGAPRCPWTPPVITGTDIVISQKQRSH